MGPQTTKAALTAPASASAQHHHQPPPPKNKNPNGLTPWPLAPTAAAAVACVAAAAAIVPRVLSPQATLALAALPSLPLVAAFLHVLLNPLERWRHRHIPGFPYKAPFGNLPDIVKAGGMPEFCLEATKVYGPTWKYWRGQTCMVVTADPDAAKKIGSRLSARGAAVGGGGVGDPLNLGLANPKATGLLLADGERFTMLKRAWQPAFAPSSLRAYAPLLRRAADGAVARLRADVNRAAKGSAVCDVQAVLAGMTMAAVGSCAFGVDWGTLSAPAAEAEHSHKDSRGAEDDDDDATNNGGATSPVVSEVDEEWRRMGRMLVSSAEEIFGGTQLSGASRWVLLAMAWPWSAEVVRFFARRFPDEPLVRRVAARQRLDAAARFLIEDARRKMDAEEQQQAREEPKPKARGVTGIEPGSFLACLMRQGTGLTTDDVAIQAQTFMLAGYHTTLSALSFAVMLLARHPDKARALHRAIDEADAARRRAGDKAGDKAQTTTTGNAADAEEESPDADACIPYANAVLDEAMRLFPPGTAVARSPLGAAMIHAERAKADAALSSPSPSSAVAAAAMAPLILPGRPGQPPVVVPNQTRSVQGVLYAIHRSPDVWPRADEFLPERFLAPEHGGDASLAASSPNAFLPFGCGARMCIGYRFALLEARTALVALFRNFEFDAAAPPPCCLAGGGGAAAAAGGEGDALAAPAPPPPIRAATGITMGPAEGAWCVVRERRAAGAAEAVAAA